MNIDHEKQITDSDALIGKTIQSMSDVDFGNDDRMFILFTDGTFCIFRAYFSGALTVDDDVLLVKLARHTDEEDWYTLRDMDIVGLEEFETFEGKRESCMIATRRRRYEQLKKEFGDA